MANELNIIVGATDKASPVLGGISSKIGGMGKAMGKTGKIMMAAGIGIVGALVGITMKTAAAGDEIAKMAKRTGLGTVALSELYHAANLSGTSLEALETGIKRMQRVIIDATDGLSTATRALDRLGISVSDLMGLSPEEQFYALASAIADLEDPTLRAAVAQEIFGRAGTDMLPMLTEGAEGLAKMREEAHELGVIFDEEAAKEAEEFQDAMFNLKESLAKAGSEVGTTLIPILTELLNDKIIPLIQNVADWIGKNEDLVKTLLKVGAVLAGAGGIIFIISKVAQAIMVVNAALAVMQGLSGPAGWAMLAAGIAIATGTIIGIKKLIGDIEVPAVPSAQHGGIVTRPTVLQVGEAGPEAIIPLRQSGYDTSSVNIHVGNLLGDESSLREFARMIKDVINQDARRTTFAGVNTLGYYGGNSAP